MAKKSTEGTELIKEITKDDETILVFRATRPMDDGEHKQLSEKLKFEENNSGIKIVLMPYSCELLDDVAKKDNGEKQEENKPEDNQE